MKFNILFLSAMVIVFFGIQSCKKDSATGGGTVPPLTTAPVLTNLYFIDTTLSHPKDTLVKCIITYDSQGRPVTVATGQINTLGDSISASRQNYYYNGNDTFVYKVIEDGRTFSGATPTSYQNTSFYKFVNEQLVSDSGYSSASGNSVSGSYNYYPTYTRKFSVFSTGTGVGSAQFAGYDYIYQTKVSGNISHQLDTAIIYPPYGSTYYERFETSISYTSGPNPFYKVGLPRNRGVLSQTSGNFSIAGDVPKNLILQQTGDFSSWPAGSGTSPYTSQVNYTYTYRPDGYPSEARYVATNSNYPAGYVQRAKIIFVYK